jgi:hypothetical protein
MCAIPYRQVRCTHARRERATQKVVREGGCEGGGNFSQPDLFRFSPMKETGFLPLETRFRLPFKSFAYSYPLT